MRSVVVVRHGERLDYVQRDAGENWIPTSDRPWDPPLTAHGHSQAKALGGALPQFLEGFKLPPIAAVYSSPFLRCRQTAAGIIEGNSFRNTGDLVRVEVGLAESMNQNWYRSWAIPGTDGTWGYKNEEMPYNELDTSKLHPAAKDSVDKILDWKLAPPDETISGRMDTSHVSKSQIDLKFCMDPPKFESYKMQRSRMSETLDLLSNDHQDQTIVLVSHGGPVTHLFESLTGEKWNVHGESKYCCYSIYHHSGEDASSWKALAVNQVLEKYKTALDGEACKESTTFTWA